MRRKRNYKRDFKPDQKYDSITASRFVNYLMDEGKKSIAKKVFYEALDEVGKKTKEDPIHVFEKALNNATPSLEVRTRRIGGANYQVPQEVRMERRFMLATRWIIGAARAKKGKTIAKKLAEELIAAANNEGEAIKKKQNTHRMAEANRAFAHFARR